MELDIPPVNPFRVVPVSSVKKSKKSQKTAVQNHSEFAKIKIGPKAYTIDRKRFPYLDAYLRFQRHFPQAPDQLPEHTDIPFFEDILYCIDKGWRYFFRRIPPDAKSYISLCDSLELLLGTEILQGQDIRDIRKEIKWCVRKINEPDYDNTARKVPSWKLKRLADEAAFKLVYQYLLGDFATGVLGPVHRDADVAFDCVKFVLMYPVSFGWRIRKVVREAHEARFIVSRKQRRELDKYSITDVEGALDSVADVLAEGKQPTDGAVRAGQS